MEIGIKSEIPTYSGGLVVLARGIIRSSADLRIPMVAVTLISRQGYLRQKITEAGEQLDFPDEWKPAGVLELMLNTVKVRINNRDIKIQSWLYNQSLTGGIVPILFLDTDVEGNASDDRKITDFLYGGDDSYRLKQEIVLGIGGIRMLEALNFKVRKYHMNEGHSSLLPLELLRKNAMNAERVRRLCIFTTHTPVEAAFDKFSYDVVKELLDGEFSIERLKEYGGQEKLNMTLLALNLSRYQNGVTKAHMEYSKKLFPGHHIHAVTNGVHSYTCTCQCFKELFDKYIPSWTSESGLLVRVDEMPDEEIWNAHIKTENSLVDFIEKKKGLKMDALTLTLGFGRRATGYKRATLIFSGLNNLKEANKKGKLQLIFAGKAHLQDERVKKKLGNYTHLKIN